MAGRNQQASQEIAIPTEQIDAFGKQILMPRKGSFDRLLPNTIDADAFVGLAMAALYKAPKVAAVALRNPESFILALRECAGLGLMPGTDEYALTFRKGTIVGIVQYQGEIKRMFNFGTVQSVHAEVICPGELFLKRDPLPPVHQVPDWNTRDTRVDIWEGEEGHQRRIPNLVGVYAYAMLEGGQCSRVVHMGRDEVMRHRAASDFHGIWDGPWGASMWLKTAVHELEKWVPRSSFYARREARVAAEMARDRPVDVAPLRSAPDGSERVDPPSDRIERLREHYAEDTSEELGVMEGEEVSDAATWPSVDPHRRNS